MFEDNNDAEKNEKDGKQFKFIDKRKYSEDSADKEINAGTADTGANTPDINDSDLGKAEETGNNQANNRDESSDIPRFEADFATFIYSLNTQALLFLGKIPNPMTGKYEKDVNTAKYLIDTIDMLSKKTKGNLDENEGKLVENILYDLRMAFISEKK